MEPNNNHELRAYSTKELAHIYGVCGKTFRKWIAPFKQEVGQRQGRYFTIAQVHIIFVRLGAPGSTFHD